MAWIESHQNMARHPKTLRLAARLGVTKAQAVGHLHLLWWWTLDYAPSGVLTGFVAGEIAGASEWPGAAEDFVAALREAGWIDADLRVHDWDDYAGRLLEGRRRNKERMRRTRESRRTSAAEAPALPATEEGGALQSEEFRVAWLEWRQHLRETGRAMSGVQETALLRECVRQGAERAAEVIRFSIRKGARNLIWGDAPRSRRRAKTPPPEVDARLWQTFLAEEFPAADRACAPDTAPEAVLADYHRWVARRL